MPKLIFSRKGFDSSSGHGYSPFDPKTRRYVVLPIPEDEPKTEVKYRYDELILKKNWFEGIDAGNLHELLHHDQLGFGKKAMEAVSEKTAHFDPMLGPCPWLEDGPDLKAFGQSESAASHLQNEGVGEGSVFLFFSRFLPIKDRVHPLAPIAGWTKGAYFLYGWMRVGQVYDEGRKDSLPREIRDGHPHGDFKTRDNNTIFVAADKLFDDMDIPGCGYFPKLSDHLMLSSNLHKNMPTIWRLPAFFNTDQFRPTYMGTDGRIHEKWLDSDVEPGYCYVQIPGRGQEFVSDLRGESLEWLRALFIKMQEE